MTYSGPDRTSARENEHGISLDKNYQTKDGKEVKLYSVSGNRFKNIHGAVFHASLLSERGWEDHHWDEFGNSNKFRDREENVFLDLVEQKETVTKWVIHYKSPGGTSYFRIWDSIPPESFKHKVISYQPVSFEV